MRKSADQVIEQVLTGLRDTQAPPGMERRMLEAIQHCRSSAPRRRLNLAWHFAYAGLACLLLLFAAAAIFSLYVLRPHPSDSTNASNPPAPRPLAQPRPTSQRTVSEAAQHTPAPGSLARSGPKPSTANADAPKTALRGPSLTLLDPPPGFPAPEAPLTEEERLLLRIAHMGDPEEIAMLDPDKRAKAEAEETSEFQSFFAQPPEPATTDTEDDE